MIDPRALQQHFRRVYQKDLPSKPAIPTIPDPKPLTAIESISTIFDQPSVIETEQKILEVPETNLDIQTNIDTISAVEILNELSEEIKIEQQLEPEHYDPYNYYSRPYF